MSTHNLCFEQKCKKKSEFLSENFQFLVVKFSIYLNRLVFVMYRMQLVTKAKISLRKQSDEELLDTTEYMDKQRRLL